MTKPRAASSLDLPPDLLALRSIGPWLKGLLASLGTTQAAAVHPRLELAVHELCVNIVNHAVLPPSALIQVDGHLDADYVTVSITDPGTGFDPDEIAEPVPGSPQIHGYGLMIIRRLVTDLQYQREPSLNRWVLRVRHTSHNEERTHR